MILLWRKTLSLVWFKDNPLSQSLDFPFRINASEYLMIVCDMIVCDQLLIKQD